MLPLRPPVMPIFHRREVRQVAVTREEIIKILDEDSYYRKIQSWPLLTIKDVSDINLTVKDCFYCRSYWASFLFNTMDHFNNRINDKHPFSQELLTKFKGHLVACGGAVIKTLIDIYPSQGEDIDLFFYDLNVENANRMRLDVIQFLIEKWKNNRKHVNFLVTRNEHVTTIYVYDYDNLHYGRETICTYQLIHRIYPNVNNILGGFDISASMFAYDGQDVFTTPLGFWGLKHGAIIIDTKRRSTSFEHRLLKYYKHGFGLIFPGLTENIIDKNDNINKLSKLLKEIEKLADNYGFDVVRDDFLQHKIDYEGDQFRHQQKQKGILPLLNINDGNNNYRRYNNGYDDDYSNASITIGTIPYNKEKIEERFIKKISDYSHSHIIPRCFPWTNAVRLRCNNLSAVVSILNNPTVNDLLYDIEHPNLGFDEKIITKYQERTEQIRNGFTTNLGEFHSPDSNYYFYQMGKCFGKLAPEVIKNRDNDEYDNYVKLMINTMKTNAEICQNNLVGIKWITQNPGRQWTSSINPIIADPRDWYGPCYIPVVTGIANEIETCLRLARLRSIWAILPDEIFDLILLHIWRNYLD